MKKIRDVLKNNKKYLIGIGVLGLLFHIYYFQSINSVMILPVFFYWMFLGITYRFSEKYFFGIALIFLLFVPIFFLQNNFSLAEKLSVWEFIFLILGLTQWILFDVIFYKTKKK
ncbi:hypothetical protein BH11PAT1_BH11PAT1_0100 [soil metagenome]